MELTFAQLNFSLLRKPIKCKLDN